MKGWRGAEWGMTPEQVAVAWKLSVAKPAQSKDDKTRWYLPTPDTQVGDWLARVELEFLERDGAKQLVAIMLRIPIVNENMKVCEELVASYGQPTTVDGRVMNWVIDKTTVSCQQRAAGVFHVRFQRRVQAF
jgi:hypothetical protein